MYTHFCAIYSDICAIYSDVCADLPAPNCARMDALEARDTSDGRLPELKRAVDGL
jgi:hypothetical protein